MPLSWALFASFLLAAAGYIVGRSRAFASAGPDVRKLHSRPTYHGYSVALTALLPALAVMAAGSILRLSGVLTVEAMPVTGILALIVAVIGLGLGVMRIGQQYQARNAVERMVLGLLMLCSLIAIVTTAGIVLSLLFETGRFFQLYDWKTFFFGTEWTPRFQGNSQLGIVPLLWGTMYVSAIALLVAVPIGLFAAVYM